MSFGTTNSCRTLETVGESATDMESEDLAIGKLNNSPSIVAVAVLSKLAIDSLLTERNSSVDLFFRVRKA